MTDVLQAQASSSESATAAAQSAASAQQIATEFGDMNAAIAQASSSADTASAQSTAAASSASAAAANATTTIQQAAIAAAANSIYATTTAGLAGVTTGKYFYVTVAGTGQILALYLNNAGTAVFQNYIPSASLYTLTSSNPTVIEGAKDGNNRLGRAILSDGTFTAKFRTVGSKNGLVVRKGSDGFYGIGLGATEGVLPLGPNSLNAIDARTTGQFGNWALARLGAAGRITGGIQANGVERFSKAQIDMPIDSPDIFDTANFTAYVKDVSGTPQIWSYNKTTGVVKQLTTAGANYAPRLDASGTNVIYAKRVVGLPKKHYYQPLGGGPEYPVFPVASQYSSFGDSLTAGTGSGVGGVGGLGYPVTLGPLLNIYVNKQGIGGQTSWQIAFRQGSYNPNLIPAGGSIPASGAVSVTRDSTAIAIGNLANVALTWTGTWAGVHGTLAMDNSFNYTFTRDTAGSAVAVSPSAPFYVDTWSTDLNPQVFWWGRNNYANPTQVLSDVAKGIAFLKPLNKRFVVLSVLNGDFSTEYVGQTGYNQIVTQINAVLAATYPNNYIDVRRTLINNATGSIEDQRCVTNDVPPTSLRAYYTATSTQDALHLNDAGYAIVANAIYAFIQSKGW
ncbi:hypothetical protein [Paraburkholderia sp. SIMBA_030]|uniref:hypothetical protein n=1 Tax=Paraburkholderia sp. SIMBA_030 TaxID=3085773 RepID=UPI00397B71AE